MKNSSAVVECVPNFSEGRDVRRVEAIVAAMRVEGVRLLDWSMDADHNRSVVTIAGPPARCSKLRCAEQARQPS